MRHHHVAQSNVLLVVRVVRHPTGHAQNEHVVHLLECAQQSGGGVARGGHRFACVANGWQLGADDSMGANVAECVDVGFACGWKCGFWYINNQQTKKQII